MLSAILRSNSRVIIDTVERLYRSMALNYPCANVTEFAELLIYASKGAKAHYGNRYEVELDVGDQPWISEDVTDDNGSPIHHCRFSLLQTNDRELGKQWNHLDLAQYKLRTIFGSNSDPELPPTDSRDFLKWLAYAGLGGKAAYQEYDQIITSYRDNFAFRNPRPMFFTNATWTFQGDPVLIVEAWIPQLVSRDGGQGWKHVNDSVFNVNPLPSMLTHFSNPD